jgi:hypothetical protein
VLSELSGPTGRAKAIIAAANVADTPVRNIEARWAVPEDGGVPEDLPQAVGEVEGVASVPVRRGGDESEERRDRMERRRRRGRAAQEKKNGRGEENSAIEGMA